MNTATLVEETLRGLPDSIIIYIPWDPELEEPGLWEDWPGDLVNQFLRNRALTRMYAGTKTKVLYFKEPPVDGSPLYEVAMKIHTLEAWLKHLAGKYPDAVVINTLPKEEALAMLAMAG